MVLAHSIPPCPLPFCPIPQVLPGGNSAPAVAGDSPVILADVIVGRVLKQPADFTVECLTDANLEAKAVCNVIKGLCSSAPQFSAATTKGQLVIELNASMADVEDPDAMQVDAGRCRNQGIAYWLVDTILGKGGFEEWVGGFVMFP